MRVKFLFRPFRLHSERVEERGSNWQSIAIHAICIPKRLEFSANLCIYSKLWPEKGRQGVGLWNSVRGLPLHPWAIFSVKKGCQHQTVSNAVGYKQGCSALFCDLLYTVWARREDVAGYLKQIKRNTSSFTHPQRVLSRIKILNLCLFQLNCWLSQ